MGINNVVSSEEGSRAACLTPVRKNSQTEKDITLGTRRRQDITVNGVSLKMKLMKMKSVNSKKKTPVRKENKKKLKEKIETPLPSSSDIRNYMMKRKTDTNDDTKTDDDIRKTMGYKRMIVKNIKEDIRECENTRRKLEAKTQKISDIKKTFRDIPTQNTSVKERIVKYQELSDNKKDECVRSGGRCHTHSCVLIREIVEKKRSTLNKTGKIVWLMGEVTILRCPLALPLLSTDNQITGVNSGDIKENISTANKKFRLSDSETVGGT